MDKVWVVTRTCQHAYQGDMVTTVRVCKDEQDAEAYCLEHNRYAGMNTYYDCEEFIVE